MASKFDIARIQRTFSDESMRNFNDFVENLPKRTSKNILIAAAVSWAFVGVCAVYINIMSSSVATLRADVLKADALKPLVPAITEISVPAAEMTPKLETAKKVFTGLNINVADGNVALSAEDSKLYGAFLQTSYAVMSLGEGYKVTLKELCEGAQCKDKNKPFLYASFDVKKLEVKTTESP